MAPWMIDYYFHSLLLIEGYICNSSTLLSLEVSKDLNCINNSELLKVSFEVNFFNIPAKSPDEDFPLLYLMVPFFVLVSVE